MWSLIASHLPGRTDNEIKNYWNSHLSRQIHTFRRTYAAGNDTTVTIDITKLTAAGKRRGGRTPGQSPRSGAKNQQTESAKTKTKDIVVGSSPAVPAKAKDVVVSTSSASSSPPQSDGARSVVVDPDQNQPSNGVSVSVSHSLSSDGPCSEDETWPLVMEPVDQTGLPEANSAVDQTAGLWEANSSMNWEGETEMEALLYSGVVPEGPAQQVDDLLDMDWEGLASDLWDAPSQYNVAQPAEPQVAATTGSADPEELESFVSWLLSDAS